MSAALVDRLQLRWSIERWSRVGFVLAGAPMASRSLDGRAGRAYCSSYDYCYCYYHYDLLLTLLLLLLLLLLQLLLLLPRPQAYAVWHDRHFYCYYFLPSYRIDATKTITITTITAVIVIATAIATAITTITVLLRLQRDCQWPLLSRRCANESIACSWMQAPEEDRDYLAL